MTTYQAPLQEMRFVLTELSDIAAVAALPGYADATTELADAVLEEAAKFAGEVLAPLNRSGDEQGVTLGPDGVVAASGFKDAYRHFVAGGWMSLHGDPLYAGQGLPTLIAAAAVEMWNSANMSFALSPLLTSGAIETINAHASEALKERYLAKMVSGEWTGTMNLTEPQAGSDLAALRTRAVREGEHYLIAGEKIFITWGDHDIADNIVHLVLARLPVAPEGVRGISLFLVPKYLPGADGSPGQRNDLRCTALEHKLGIHASPTCVMTFGQGKGAIGYLVGEENAGLAHMFTMMNEARQKVGLQALGISERAYQQAREYAKGRVQGRMPGQKGGERVTIVHHPDVRRMLLTMKALIEAMRGFCYTVSVDIDFAHRHTDRSVRAARAARVNLLTPIVKGWCTELAQEVTSLGLQVHGGMGYIEATGACQYLRDARITTIYEGTTGIQAGDLLGRKLAGDGGSAMAALVGDMRACAEQLEGSPEPGLPAIGEALAAGVGALEDATRWMLATYGTDPNAALARSVDYLMLSGYVCGAWQMARAAQIASRRLRAENNDGFYTAKLMTAQYYLTQIVPRVDGLLRAIRAVHSPALTMAEEWL